MGGTNQSWKVGDKLLQSHRITNETHNTKSKSHDPGKPEKDTKIGDHTAFIALDHNKYLYKKSKQIGYPKKISSNMAR